MNKLERKIKELEQIDESNHSLHRGSDEIQAESATPKKIDSIEFNPINPRPVEIKSKPAEIQPTNSNRNESNTEIAGRRNIAEEARQRSQQALDKIYGSQQPGAHGVGESNEYLFNKIKDLESMATPDPIFHQGADETYADGGMDYDYYFIGTKKVIPPTKTTDFLKIPLNGSAASWVEAMPETQDADAVVVDVTKNRIYIHGAFA